MKHFGKKIKDNLNEAQQSFDLVETIPKFIPNTLILST